MTTFGDVNVGDKVRLAELDGDDIHTIRVTEIWPDRQALVSRHGTYHEANWRLVEVLEKGPKPLPDVDGVYMPATQKLTSGPNVFVRYKGRFGVAESAAQYHQNVGGLIALVPMSEVESARKTAEQDAKTAFSLYRAEQAEANRQSKIADKLSDALEAVRALVMNTDGDYLASEDFDGLAGCIQQALAQHGFLGGKS